MKILISFHDGMFEMNEIMQCKIILKLIILLDGEKMEEQTANDRDTIETDQINEEKKDDREVDYETKEELEQD